MRRFAANLPCSLTGLLVLILLFAGLPAAAQEPAAQLKFFSLSAEDFPQITSYLDVHDTQGNFIHDLQAEQVQVLEDNNTVPVDKLEEMRPGVQFVVAIAPGASFDIRDANGISRYDYLRQSIYNWTVLADAQDDYSLISPWGSEIAHVSGWERILAGLTNYQPVGEQIYPDLQVLSRALELAANPTPRPGMERAILFITAPQAAEGVIGLQSLAARAAELGVRIYVWVIAPLEFFDQQDSAPLRAVSGQTGGRFFAFSGSETVPSLEEILSPLRTIYQITYTSRLTTSGSHQAAILLTLGETQVTSPSQTFELTLLPPQLVFVSLPSLIQRSVPSEQDTGQTSTATIELLPVEQALEVMISFPDDYVRPLVRTTLYVDGMIVAENTSPPFENFTWDLRGYLQSGTHVLQVEALDSLGMTGVSLEMSVQVEVATPQVNILAALLRNKLMLAGIAATLAVAVLALVLILSGKLRPPHPAHPRKPSGSSKRPAAHPRRSEPVLQSEPIPPVAPAADGEKTRPRRRDTQPTAPRKPATKPLAYLTPLVEAGGETLPTVLPLYDEQAVLGSDPSKATVLLANASVEAVHAILHWEAGSFRLVDNGTVAGSWVNYAPVGPQGVRLAHNDLVYAGRVGFRFNLTNPGPQPKPVVRPYQEPGK